MKKENKSIDDEIYENNQVFRIHFYFSPYFEEYTY